MFNVSNITYYNNTHWKVVIATYILTLMHVQAEESFLVTQHNISF